MKLHFGFLVALPLALGLVAGPASAGSMTNDSVSRRLATERSMQGVPSDARNVQTKCNSFGPSTHYRCRTTWDD